MKETIGGLEHVVQRLRDGGEVLVLNTGAHIHPEAEAMLQALHSRSSEGVRSHMKVLAEKGPDKFMSVYYVGYGHKSIGDCGTGTVFIEGVSMLAAKAVQDWMLYSGQECSTRYLDFGLQRFANPYGTENGKAVLEEWRNFYIALQEPVRAHLREQFPKPAEENEKIYEKAIIARSFDTLRCFLPAGATTNLAWHSNLRQFADKITLLRHHPLSEVRDIAETLEKALQESFPNSFQHKRYDETEKYNECWMKHSYYFSVDNPCFSECSLTHNGVNVEQLEYYKAVLERRPPQTELPKFIGACGAVQFDLLLDFGSFRDIQRHRAIVQRMPLLTPHFGFERWYLEQLPCDLREKAECFIARQLKIIESLEVSAEERQYYLPMGYRVPIRISGDLPSLAYLVELRSSPSVHPTLQKKAVMMAEELKDYFGQHGLRLHIQEGAGRFDIKRGKQDIVKKE
ncbi:MAG: FAD-dependent thymidylate synthase [Patescibacteria group bacterium]|nr:FAD-dependent thymidylate synthase [bacterium]MDZ4241012.1 FAD-dependent thymidylate synthase [Patescibacteria group bacterium]